MIIQYFACGIANISGPCQMPFIGAVGLIRVYTLCSGISVLLFWISRVLGKVNLVLVLIIQNKQKQVLD